MPESAKGDAMYSKWAWVKTSSRNERSRNGRSSFCGNELGARGPASTTEQTHGKNKTTYPAIAVRINSN